MYSGLALTRVLQAPARRVALALLGAPRGTLAAGRGRRGGGGTMQRDEEGRKRDAGGG